MFRQSCASISLVKKQTKKRIKISGKVTAGFQKSNKINLTFFTHQQQDLTLSNKPVLKQMLNVLLSLCPISGSNQNTSLTVNSDVRCEDGNQLMFNGSPFNSKALCVARHPANTQFSPVHFWHPCRAVTNRDFRDSAFLCICAELKSCMKVKVDILGFPSVIVCIVSVAVKQYLKKYLHVWKS